MRHYLVLKKNNQKKKDENIQKKIFSPNKAPILTAWYEFQDICRNQTPAFVAWQTKDCYSAVKTNMCSNKLQLKAFCYLDFLAMCDGIEPSILSIIARCSLFSCV